ncbi:hypothetical protein Vretimale_12813 [Volvox reticuliferus]|uniref:Uncharacterized protein n=1 Tax=Volvox reticuliferus TaxID=1737510 RepID=A0A8J4CC95_9CHLO|nr:hypothetical protein Vretifemale_9177 [Volvox reticuliferus]GIM08849.1 hypothetical protein Vretimale_12813 [Volvox reticuliferus]
MLWQLGRGRQTTSVVSAERLLTAVPRSANTRAMIAQLSGAPASMPSTFSASKNGSRQARSRNVRCAAKRGSTSGQPNSVHEQPDTNRQLSWARFSPQPVACHEAAVTCSAMWVMDGRSGVRFKC